MTENLYVAGPVPIGENLEEAVRELVRGLPKGAVNMIVMVFEDDKRIGLTDKFVMNLPIVNYPTFGKTELIGMVSVGYGLGKKE